MGGHSKSLAFSLRYCCPEKGLGPGLWLWWYESGSHARCLRVGLTVVVDGFYMGVEGKRSQGWCPREERSRSSCYVVGKGFSGEDRCAHFGVRSQAVLHHTAFHRHRAERDSVVGR